MALNQRLENPSDYFVELSVTNKVTENFDVTTGPFDAGTTVNNNTDVQDTVWGGDSPMSTLFTNFHSMYDHLYDATYITRIDDYSLLGVGGQVYFGDDALSQDIPRRSYNVVTGITTYNTKTSSYQVQETAPIPRDTSADIPGYEFNHYTPWNNYVYDTDTATSMFGTNPWTGESYTGELRQNLDLVNQFLWEETQQQPFVYTPTKFTFNY